MIELSTSLVLALHLWCVSVASVGPLVSAWLDWVGRNRDDLSWQAAKFLSLKSLALLVLGTGLGLAATGLIWSDAYHELMHAFMYKIKWAGWELLFSFALMASHAYLLCRGPARHLAGRLTRAAIALLAATNLLYHFPTLLLVVSEMNAGYLEQPKAVDAALFRTLMSQPSVLARSFHFVLASLAVTGITLVAHGARLKRQAETEANGHRLAIWGGRIALVPTLLQILVGIWVLAVVPPAMQQRLMGGDMLASGLMACSIIGAPYLMHQLSAVALGDTSPRQLKLAVWTMIAVVVMMTATARRAAPPKPKASPINSTEAEHAD
ncbi:MAG: hypothetical protein CMJ64_05410 [Planctomycetaceae bacterium]|nr:hypothetical protein [Planctomycetaceae bacterium]